MWYKYLKCIEDNTLPLLYWHLKPISNFQKVNVKDKYIYVYWNMADAYIVVLVLKVACVVNFFDFDFPLPCFHFTSKPIQSIYCGKDILLKNKLSITNTLFKKGVIFVSNLSTVKIL